VTAPALSPSAGAAAVEPVTAAAPVPPLARAVRQAPHRPRDVENAAYDARMQAELCLARTVFCGLDSRGRYPGR
jgi:hypothetical protein